MTDLPNTDKNIHFFPGFRRLDACAGGVRFSGVIGGSGPPVLMLHGYPQTHIAWRKVASALARHFTLVIPDLPGYGDSVTDSPSPRWTKRRVGAALADLMAIHGYERFAIVGHDRGARAGYRLALDLPDRVTAYASLTVMPTLDAMDSVNYRFAASNFHWFFFGQEADLPEKMLAAEPDLFIDRALARMAGGLENVDAEALSVYRAAFRKASVRHAICEDYRAALNEDLEMDRKDRADGRQLACPVLVLWPAKDRSPDMPSPITIWSAWAERVEGCATRGGHLQPEDAPEDVLAALIPFLESACALPR